jgi:Flp pilus assembly protein TadG
MAVSFGMKFSALRRRMRKDATRGSAALEFAFIAPVFFIMLFAIMETGIMYFAQFALQNAVVQAARQIRTGQAQSIPTTGTDNKCNGTTPIPTGAYTSQGQWFNDQICCGIAAMLSCTNLNVNVQSYASGFGGNNFSNTQVAGLYQPVTNNYNPGNPCDVVLVRATYTWTVFTPILSWFLVNMAGNAHMLSATTAFRNEPYTNANGGC